MYVVYKTPKKKLKLYYFVPLPSRLPFTDNQCLENVHIQRSHRSREPPIGVHKVVSHDDGDPRPDRNPGVVEVVPRDRVCSGHNEYHRDLQGPQVETVEGAWRNLKKMSRIKRGCTRRENKPALHLSLIHIHLQHDHI